MLLCCVRTIISFQKLSDEFRCGSAPSWLVSLRSVYRERTIRLVLLRTSIVSYHRVSKASDNFQQVTQISQSLPINTCCSSQISRCCFACQLIPRKVWCIDLFKQIFRTRTWCHKISKVSCYPMQVGHTFITIIFCFTLIFYFYFQAKILKHQSKKSRMFF